MKLAVAKLFGELFNPAVRRIQKGGLIIYQFLNKKYPPVIAT